MPRLVACPHCQSHAMTTEPRCPHCGGSLRARGGLALTAAAALLGLSPVACDKEAPQPSPPSDSGGVAEPEYGVPVTGGQDAGPTDPDQDPDFAAEYGVPATDDPEPPPQDDPGFEPEYGVPISDDTMQPMYGVPDSEL